MLENKSLPSAPHIKALEQTACAVLITYRHRLQCHAMVGAHCVNLKAFRLCKEKSLL